MERRVRDAAVRIVEFGSEREEREGDLDEEERRDDDRYQGEHLEPGWGLGWPGDLAVGGQEGIGEVDQDARGVYDDLQEGCGMLVVGETKCRG